MDLLPTLSYALLHAKNRHRLCISYKGQHTTVFSYDDETGSGEIVSKSAVAPATIIFGITTVIAGESPTISYTSGVNGTATILAIRRPAGTIWTTCVSPTRIRVSIACVTVLFDQGKQTIISVPAIAPASTIVVVVGIAVMIAIGTSSAITSTMAEMLS